MTRLTCMRGLPASGKSARAAEIADATGAVIVNRDLLRLQLLGSYWTGKSEDEQRVTIAEEAQVKALLKADVDVIVDATHLHPPFLRKWAKLATRMGVDFEVVDIPTDMATCQQRDRDRQAAGERSVGDAVIAQQARRFPIKDWPTITAEPFVVEPVKWVDGLLEAIIVDIDGTLAEIPDGGRSPYDYTRVSEDEVIEPVRDLVNLWYDTYSGRVIILSGRDDACRDETHQWLVDNDVMFDKLLMRPTGAKDASGNKFPDFRVKYDLFNEHIRGRYHINFVIDDRLQVCELWHRLGLPLFRVGDPNADF